MSNLNPEQKRAVETREGPVLVVAGAGAGKTKVIIERIRGLIAANVPPKQILAVTFTNKAAGEMKERLRISEEANPPFIGTFHALGLLLIKENLKKLGIGKTFSILDEDDSLKVIKECLEELSLDPKQYDPSRIKNQISKFKNQLTAVEELGGETLFVRTLSKIWARYEEKNKTHNALDFDDLLVRPTVLLLHDEELLRVYQNRWRYIHIDEYQDTNEVQYTLSKLLAAAHRNIFVVGDVDQAIYSWRGADFKNILNFQRDYKEAKVITLEENYRSTDIILEAANAVIARNALRLPKNLWTSRSGTEPIKVIYAGDERMEAEMVISEIMALRQASKRAGTQLPLGKIALLYRTNAQSRALEEAFLAHQIPYKIIGGIRFYERREVKDILAYLKLVQNPEDRVSKKRIINVPPRGIGKTLMLKIFGNIPNLKPEEKAKTDAFEKLIEDLRQKAKDLSPRELIHAVLKTTGYREYIDDGTEKGAERWLNIEELIGVAKKMETLEAFLEHVSLFSIDDKYDPSEDRVNLMTIHTAKGLEFEAVFVVGLEEGLFPHTLSREAEHLEEERRLYYVALTRARTHLYLTLAGRRLIFGERVSNIPSRFLREIPEHLLLHVGKPHSLDLMEEDIIIE